MAIQVDQQTLLYIAGLIATTQQALVELQSLVIKIQSGTPIETTTIGDEYAAELARLKAKYEGQEPPTQGDPVA